LIHRRAALAAAAAAALLGPAHAHGGVWQALRAPGHLALIRHALAPGSHDPPGFRLGDCATQRNLSDEGRAQARALGDAFRREGLIAAPVFSSQWCRCVETARLLSLGEVVEEPLLNSFIADRRRGEAQMTALRARIAAMPAGPPPVFVTHQVVVTALTGIHPGSGELIVVERRATELLVRGRVSVGG